PDIIPVALEPGWVKTDMGSEGPCLNLVSVSGILKILEGLTSESAGILRISGGMRLLGNRPKFIGGELLLPVVIWGIRDSFVVFDVDGQNLDDGVVYSPHSFSKINVGEREEPSQLCPRR
ncbi:hypothetical protein BU15DRAFT_55378, partial [Melanogaster broomeanus]